MNKVLTFEDVYANLTLSIDDFFDIPAQFIDQSPESYEYIIVANKEEVNYFRSIGVYIKEPIYFDYFKVTVGEN